MEQNVLCALTDICIKFPVGTASTNHIETTKKHYNSESESTHTTSPPFKSTLYSVMNYFILQLYVRVLYCNTIYGPEVSTFLAKFRPNWNAHTTKAKHFTTFLYPGDDYYCWNSFFLRHTKTSFIVQHGTSFFFYCISIERPFICACCVLLFRFVYIYSISPHTMLCLLFYHILPEDECI